jgi:ParB/RepB/Spo0J family partition protein
MPQLEFHQLDRRLEHLRVRHPSRFRRLLASLSESGPQTPVIVIPCQQRYLVIDGYQRIAALEQLRRDTVDAFVWEMSESEALLLVRSLRMNSEPETALEQGWLLQEMESRLGCSIEELARRFDRSATWVARRLALVETLPESVQRQVREGRIAPQIAMRYLTPVARLDLDQCVRMAQIFSQPHWTTRKAAALYQAWRGTRSRRTKERILAAPELFLKAQQQQPAAATDGLENDLRQMVALAKRALHREEPVEVSPTLLDQIEQATRLLAQLVARIQEQNQQEQNQQEQNQQEQNQQEQNQKEEKQTHHVEPIATHHDSGTTGAGEEQTRDRETVEPLAAERAQGARSELQRRSEDRTRRESSTAPPTDHRTAAGLQGQSRAGP